MVIAPYGTLAPLSRSRERSLGKGQSIDISYLLLAQGHTQGAKVFGRQAIGQDGQAMSPTALLAHAQQYQPGREQCFRQDMHRHGRAIIVIPQPTTITLVRQID